MSLSDVALVDLIQAKNYLRVDASAFLRVNAEYVGTGNASNVTFYLDYVSIEGSLALYVENILQVEETDYTIVLSTKRITFKAASTPGASEIVTASYDKAAGDDTFESYDDELLEGLIAAATRKAEEYTGRAFIRREIVETHIGDGTKILKLYKQPIDAEVAIAITIDGDDLETWSERLSIGRLYATWGNYTEIIVTYTAGYAATRADTQTLVPDAVSAVLLILADLYENRGDKVDSISITGIGSTSYKLPSRAEELLNSLRINIL